eukprot:1740832-Rhodomonas_salina.4
MAIRRSCRLADDETLTGTDRRWGYGGMGLFNERVTHGWRAVREWGVLPREALVWGGERATYWSLAAWGHHRVPTEP